MTAILLLDQAGLPAGNPGFARTDGLATGALVTVSSVGGGTTHALRLLWVPPTDTTAVASLTQTTPTTWTFSPTPGAVGTYRIELTVDAGTSLEDRQIRAFAMRTPNLGLLIPAANEGADPGATLANVGAAQIGRSEQNEPFGPFVAGSAWGWFRALEEMALALDTGGGVGIRYRIPAPLALVVQADFQYLVKAPLIIDPGASLTAVPGGQIVVLP